MAGELVFLTMLGAAVAWVTAQAHPRRTEVAAAVASEPPSITSAEVRTLAAAGRDVVWVDARAAEAFAAGSVAGAVSLPEGEFEDRIVALLEVWEPGALVVVFCDSRSCGTSRAIARRLRGEFALVDVRVLEGGWEGMVNDQ